MNRGMMGLLKELATFLTPLTSTPDNLKSYVFGVQKSAKIWPLMAAVIMNVGQIQLIRRMIAQELNFSCQFDSKHLSGTLSVLNESLLNDIEEHYQDPTKPHPGEDSPLMSETSSYL